MALKLAFLMLATTLGVRTVPPGVEEAYGAVDCPKGAIGEVKVVKDGYLVRGDEIKDQMSADGTLTAWFSTNGSSARAVITVVVDPNTHLHALVGSVKIQRGIFCAYPNP